MLSPLNANKMQVDENERRKANAFLRERFLYLISSVCGNKTCTIRMYDNTEVTGLLKAFDINSEHVIVENLKTPLPEPLKTAVLRISDILTISFG